MHWILRSNSRSRSLSSSESLASIPIAKFILCVSCHLSLSCRCFSQRAPISISMRLKIPSTEAKGVKEKKKKNARKQNVLVAKWGGWSVSYVVKNIHRFQRRDAFRICWSKAVQFENVTETVNSVCGLAIFATYYDFPRIFSAIHLQQWQFIELNLTIYLIFDESSMNFLCYIQSARE